MVVPLVSSASSVDRYLVYLDGEPFVPLLLASYWCLVLKRQLGNVAHSPLLVPPPGMDSPWKFVLCLKIMKVRFAGCLRLICRAYFKESFKTAQNAFHHSFLRFFSSKFTTTTAQFPFYNCKLHFTAAQIVISCTLKYALLICIAVVGLGAPLSRFLEGAPYKFLNE